MGRNWFDCIKDRQPSHYQMLRGIVCTIGRGSLTDHAISTIDADLAFTARHLHRFAAVLLRHQSGTLCSAALVSVR
jgi:hypothetical protein